MSRKRGKREAWPKGWLCRAILEAVSAGCASLGEVVEYAGAQDSVHSVRVRLAQLARDGVLVRSGAVRHARYGEVLS